MHEHMHAHAVAVSDDDAARETYWDLTADLEKEQMICNTEHSTFGFLTETV